MNFLALSTAEQYCSLAVIENDTLIYEEFWSSRLTHSKRVLKMIEHVLENRTDIKLADIDAFVAAKGPGSFTGLRIGISVMQGLAFSTGKPAIGVSSLEGIAFRFSQVSSPVCVMMDARRNEVYCAVYRFDKGELVSKSPEQVLNPQKAISMAGDNALFVGTGSKVYKNIIENNASNFTISDTFSDSTSAANMVQALTCRNNFSIDSENILTPSYIRKSDAELQFADKKG